MELQNRFLNALGRTSLVALGTFALGVASTTAHADGTEVLGPPSIGISDGTGFAAGGVGLSAMGDGQPGTIEVTVPDGTAVRQVLLYWDGAIPDDGAVTSPELGVTTDVIEVEGQPVEGVFIGGALIPGFAQLLTFRADITGLGLVGPGFNALSVQGVDFGVEHGAGALVIYDDGSPSALPIFDGNDFAYFRCASDPACSTTETRTFTFPASDSPRMADLTLFFASVSGTQSSGGFRPTTIKLWIGAEAPILFNDLLDSVDGQEWDTVRLSVEIPAGVTEVRVQALSEDNSGTTGNAPASFVWLTAALSVPLPEGGGDGCTPGYWRQPHHFADWTAPFDPEDLFSSVFEDAFPGWTLLDVVKARGGGLNALGRHSVAALLNAASSEVDYDLSVQEVINAFNDAHPGTWSDYNRQKDRFEHFNEQGCPLNNSDGSNFRGDDAGSTAVATSGERPVKKMKKNKKNKKKKGKAKGKKKGKARGKAKGHAKP